MIIDRKFKIKAVNPCSGKTYTEKDGVFFCAHDKCLPIALFAYLEACSVEGCGEEHLESIRLLMDRVFEYQEKTKKKPDTETDCEIDRCIGGINL